MASVALHPLASRSGNQSSTIVSVETPADRTPTLSSSAPLDRQACFSASQGDVFSSSTTARATSPNPFADEWQAGRLSNGREWGLRHDDLDKTYPVINARSLLNESQQLRDESPTSAFPVRAMTAEQFAKLHQQYVELDVPHSVLFPFLHGVDGDNPAQCAFFHAPLTGQPTPHYRGLTVIRADMPTHEQVDQQRRRASSSASKLSMFSSQRSRTDSLVSSSNFSAESVSSEDEDDEDYGEQFCDDIEQARVYGSEEGAKSIEESAGDKTEDLGTRTIVASHSASSGSSSASDSRASSLFSFAGSDTTMSTMMTQCDGDAFKAAESAALHARDTRKKSKRSRDHQFGGCQRRRQSKLIVEPQPSHSMLVSTVMPEEVISPPLIANAAANRLDVAQQSQPMSDDRRIVKSATFVRPRQAEGISLRNFRTQCAKYATISDIVIYCPAGLHEGALNLAEWTAQAQETCYAHRMQRNLGGLRYNVFLVTDTFDVFERAYPHLVAVDGSGFSRQRVDFIDREREEMQRFTSASEIDENVFMGCTANVPFAMDEVENGSSASLDSYLPLEVNPLCLSICIETAEHSDMPTPSRLSHASHYLDAFEATTLFELNSQDALRVLHEDYDDEEEEASIGHRSTEDDGVRPSLGPSGWSPSLGKSEVRSVKMPDQNGVNGGSSPSQTYDEDAQQQILCPLPNNLVHLRALGSGSCFEDDEAEDEAIEHIVQLCAWMYKQARPNDKAQSSRRQSHATARRTHRSSSSASSWPKHQQQLPRRILLHCSDGYTDSSILGLAYLMYSRNLTLPQAYLDLQNRCERCFFIYGRDVPFLQRLEKQMMREQSIRLNAERQCNSWSTCEDRIPRRLGSLGHRREHEEQSLGVHLGSSQEQSVWARGLAAATGLVTGAGSTGGSANSGKRSAETARTSTPTPRRSTPTPQSPHREVNSHQALLDDSWFYNPYFQGSFPSRILPFLYLGNLAHAMNPAMLHALGITHVVSVGESALVPPSTEENLVDAAAAASAHGGLGVQFPKPSSPSRKRKSVQSHKTLWEEERIGRLAVLDLKNVSDDGIDSLRPHMNRAIEFIEQARLQGGKVLVHCRVGVSRSATVCIAYVMAHCDLSMIESFLLVRSRRMNVLTQPTLLFVWELRGIETHLIKLKERRQQRHSSKSQGFNVENNGLGCEDSEMHDVDGDCFSLSALSISSNEASQDNATLRRRSQFSSKENAVYRSVSARQSIFSDEDLQVDIGAGAGSVYGFQVRHYADRDFNSGSLTRLDHRAARLTHGCFCKLLSELNARYMVA